MKITPKDYIEVQGDLVKAGFMCIKTLLADNDDGAKSPSDVAVLYGIDVKAVELVKTTSSYSEYETITNLETERESLQQELLSTKVEEARVKPKTWHYVVASVILVGILAGLVWGVVQLVNFIGGLF